MDIDLGVDDSEGGEEMAPDAQDSNPDISEVQSLTGELGQVIRETSPEALDSDTIKYVLNSIISAFDMSKLTDTDRNDIFKKMKSGGGSEGEKEELAEDELDLSGQPVDGELNTPVGEPEGSEVSMVAQLTPTMDVGSVLNKFISTIARYDKSLAEKISPFAKRESLKSRLKEINAELSEMREKDINNLPSIEEEDI